MGKAKKSSKQTMMALPLPGKEITGCVHIMEIGKVPQGRKDRVGDQYMDTADRDTYIGRYTPKIDSFVNIKEEFEAMFDLHKVVRSKLDTNRLIPVTPQDNQEIMFYLKDETNPNPKSADNPDGTDGWMPYDEQFIQSNGGLFFIIQRKFFDGKYGPDPADGFKAVAHHDIITHLGRHSDRSMCILVSIRDKEGKIINDDGFGGEPPGVGAKVPPDPNDG